MKVILVCGKRGSGKDTFANVINGCIEKKNLSGKFFIKGKREGQWKKLDESDFCSQNKPIVKLASPLKKSILGGLMGLKVDEIENYEKIKDDPDKIEFEGCIRDYMIAVAETVRKMDPAFFAKRLFSDLSEREEETFICTDWRYPNECEYFLSKNIDVIKIRINREKNDLPHLNHHSEISLDDYPVDFDIHVIE
jgi:hypothetical protein